MNEVLSPKITFGEIDRAYSPLISFGEISVDYSNYVVSPLISFGEASPSTLTVVASGGVSVGGTATIRDNLPIIAQGGVVVSGDAIVPNTYHPPAKITAVITITSPERYEISSSIQSRLLLQSTYGRKVVITPSLTAVVSLNTTYSFISARDISLDGVFEVYSDFAFGKSLTIDIAPDEAETDFTITANRRFTIDALYDNQGFSASIYNWKLDGEYTGADFPITLKKGILVSVDASFEVYSDIEAYKTHIVAIDIAPAEAELDINLLKKGFFSLDGDARFCVVSDIYLTPTIPVTLDATFSVESDITLAELYKITMDAVVEVISDIEVERIVVIVNGKTLVMNIASRGITEFEGMAFSSMCYHNGKYYLANETGLYEYTGDTDNGTSIDALVKTGKMALISPSTKSPRDAWVKAETDGGLAAIVYGVEKEDQFGTGRYKAVGSVVNVETDAVTGDDIETCVYPLDNVRDDMVSHKGHLGRGKRKNTIQIGIANMNGSDFVLQSVEVEANESKRRR